MLGVEAGLTPGEVRGLSTREIQLMLTYVHSRPGRVG